MDTYLGGFESGSNEASQRLSHSFEKKGPIPTWTEDTSLPEIDRPCVRLGLRALVLDQTKDGESLLRPLSLASPSAGLRDGCAKDLAQLPCHVLMFFCCAGVSVLHHPIHSREARARSSEMKLLPGVSDGHVPGFMCHLLSLALAQLSTGPSYE